MISIGRLEARDRADLISSLRHLAELAAPTFIDHLPPSC
jgi:hypothetical protein